jgi:hypothetical protein
MTWSGARGQGWRDELQYEQVHTRVLSLGRRGGAGHGRRGGRVTDDGHWLRELLTVTRWPQFSKISFSLSKILLNFQIPNFEIWIWTKFWSILLKFMKFPSHDGLSLSKILLDFQIPQFWNLNLNQISIDITEIHEIHRNRWGAILGSYLYLDPCFYYEQGPTWWFFHIFLESFQLWWLFLWLIFA